MNLFLWIAGYLFIGGVFIGIWSRELSQIPEDDKDSSVLFVVFLWPFALAACIGDALRELWT